MALKAYMGYSKGAGSAEGAILVFAHDEKEAKTLAMPFLQDWFQSDLIDGRVRWIEKAQHLFDTEANKEKVAADIAHVIDSPTVCKRCEQWGYKLNEEGICGDCKKEMDDDDEPPAKNELLT